MFVMLEDFNIDPSEVCFVLWEGNTAREKEQSKPIRSEDSQFWTLPTDGTNISYLLTSAPGMLQKLEMEANSDAVRRKQTGSAESQDSFPDEAYETCSENSDLSNGVKLQLPCVIVNTSNSMGETASTMQPHFKQVNPKRICETSNLKQNYIPVLSNETTNIDRMGLLVPPTETSKCSTVIAGSVCSSTSDFYQSKHALRMPALEAKLQTHGQKQPSNVATKLPSTKMSPADLLRSIKQVRQYPEKTTTVTSLQKGLRGRKLLTQQENSTCSSLGSSVNLTSVSETSPHMLGKEMRLPAVDPLIPDRKSKFGAENEMASRTASEAGFSRSCSQASSRHSKQSEIFSVKKLLKKLEQKRQEVEESSSQQSSTTVSQNQQSCDDYEKTSYMQLLKEAVRAKQPKQRGDCFQGYQLKEPQKSVPSCNAETVVWSYNRLKRKRGTSQKGVPNYDTASSLAVMMHTNDGLPLDNSEMHSAKNELCDQKTMSDNTTSQVNTSEHLHSEETMLPGVTQPKRKRGRPPKNKSEKKDVKKLCQKLACSTSCMTTRSMSRVLPNKETNDHPTVNHDKSISQAFVKESNKETQPGECSSATIKLSSSLASQSTNINSSATLASVEQQLSLDKILANDSPSNTSDMEAIIQELMNLPMEMASSNSDSICGSITQTCETGHPVLGCHINQEYDIDESVRHFDADLAFLSQDLDEFMYSDYCTNVTSSLCPSILDVVDCLVEKDL